MNDEKKPLVALIIAIISAVALIAVPIVNRLLDIYLPTPVPVSPIQSIPLNQSLTHQPSVNYPTATQPLLATQTNTLTNRDMNNLLGAGNWFCLPDIQDAIGIIKLPSGFVVKYPIGNIDSSGGKYNEGQTVHGISGTAWLSSALPLSECPPEQEVALNNWRAQSSIPITRELINSIIGAGNWDCTSANWNITVKSFPSNWAVQFPFTSADINGKKFGVGYVVSGGSTGTLNMVNMPREQCP
jgi:hypothetical protein